MSTSRPAEPRAMMPLALIHPGSKVSGLAALLVLLMVLHGLLYTALIPPWQGPDEPKHFEYLRLLYEKRHLVSLADTDPLLQEAIVNSMSDHDFWRLGFWDPSAQPSRQGPFYEIWWDSPTLLHRPPLYYLALLPAEAAVAGQPIEVQLYVARLVSLLMGVLTVLLAYRTAQAIFPGRPRLATAVGGFVALQPVFAFISGTMNSDNLVNLLCAFLFYLLAVTFWQGLSWGRILGIALAVGLALVTKRTTFFVVPLIALAWPAYALSREGRERRRWLLVSAVGIVAALIAGVVVWQVPAWQQQMAQGFVVLLDRYLFNGPGQTGAILARFQSPEIVPLLWSYLVFLFESFWARFGWMTVRLDDAWYVALLVVTALSVLGLAVAAVRRRMVVAGWQKGIFLVYALGITLAVGSSLAFQTIYTAYWSPPQGRYFFSVLTPIALFYVLGLRALVPGRLRPLAVPVSLVALALFDVLCLLGYVVPYFYGNP